MSTSSAPATSVPASPAGSQGCRSMPLSGPRARKYVLDVVDGEKHCAQQALGQLAHAVADNTNAAALRTRLHTSDARVAASGPHAVTCPPSGPYGGRPDRHRGPCCSPTPATPHGSRRTSSGWRGGCGRPSGKPSSARSLRAWSRARSRQTARRGDRPAQGGEGGEAAGPLMPKDQRLWAEPGFAGRQARSSSPRRRCVAFDPRR